MEFCRDGIHFDYPEQWTLEEEDHPHGWTATFQGEGASFAVLHLRDDVIDPSFLAEQVLEAFREDYPTLDVEETVETMSGIPALGHDLEFISMDVTSSCQTRSLYTPVGCLLVLFQGPDTEDTQGVFASMRSSLHIDEEENDYHIGE